MKGRVVCLGEILLRICPDTLGSWIAQQALPVYIGGAELNVARALAKWNVPVSFVSRVPDNFLSTQVVRQLEQENIDTSGMLRGGRRIGLYFLPTGETIQNQGVIYDREGSSFWDLKRGMIDWDVVFEGASWFHCSAINPALNDDIAWLCEEAMKVAHEKGLTVSIDLNYRPKLWKTGRDPRWVMESLLPYCQVVMGNVWAADSMLGVHVNKSLQTHSKEACVEHAHITSHRIMQLFPDVRQVYNTFRFETNELSYFATLNTATRSYVSTTYRAANIVDKVGSGDCFMAGIIHGTVHNKGPQETLDFCTSAAFQKLFTVGDTNARSTQEIVLFSASYAS